MKEEALIMPFNLDIDYRQLSEITVPKDWDYADAVERFKDLKKNCYNLYREVRRRRTEVIIELAIAHRALTERTKKRNRLKPWHGKTFVNFCEEIGVSPKTIYRWFQTYLGWYYLYQIKIKPSDFRLTELTNDNSVKSSKQPSPQNILKMDIIKKHLPPKEEMALDHMMTPGMVKGKTDHGIRKPIVFYFNNDEDYWFVVDCLADKNSITYKKRFNRKSPPIMDEAKLVKLLKRAKKKGELST